jgi:hemerythrin-like domain-containing protein
MLKKNLTPEHKKIMNELLDEHKLGRKIINQLIESNDAYLKGDENQVDNIIARFKDFVSIYSKHIDKEDNDYFIKVMKYFTEAEQEELIQNFWRFDIKLIHKKYERLFDLMEGE